MKEQEAKVNFTMIRIDNARVALDNSTSEWAKQYWENVLYYMIKLGNRIN
jgi:hypothetical protein